MDAISEVTAQLTSDQRLDVIGKTTEQLTSDQRLSKIGTTIKQAAIANPAEDQGLGDSQSGARVRLGICRFRKD